MPKLFLLSRAQMRRIKPFFPKPRGLPRVDDRRVISGIVYVIRNGLQWKDAPRAYGPRGSHGYASAAGQVLSAEA